MIGVGTNYRTVAVIGCQSSGKSKLRYAYIIL
jgi:nicotinamide riboside kinase